MLTSRMPDRSMSSCSANTTPPTNVIGATTSRVHVISTSICTCWTSFVIRVISDGAPNAPTSRAENAVTRWNNFVRTSRPKPIAARDPK